MPKRLCLALAILLSLPVAALAHSFNLLLVVPGDAAIADDMRLAVLLAADERDGHPDNHSDGHLGGLDVYLKETQKLVPSVVSENDADIVLDVLLFPLSQYADGDPERLALYGTDLDRMDRDAMLATAADPGVAPFQARFRVATGRDPGPEAQAAYVGARVVDLIVRPLDSADDPGALREELDRLH